jgi:hypothetical protein
VVDSAGFSVIGDNLGTYIVRARDGDLLVWARPLLEQMPLAEVLGEWGYREVNEVDGVRLYSDELSFFWEVQELRVWVAIDSAPSVPTEDVLVSLIRASTRVEYSGPA